MYEFSTLYGELSKLRPIIRKKVVDVLIDGKPVKSVKFTGKVLELSSEKAKKAPVEEVAQKEEKKEPFTRIKKKKVFPKRPLQAKKPDKGEEPLKEKVPGLSADDINEIVDPQKDE